MLEKTLESPLDSKEIQQVHPKENQSWIFIGRTDAEAEIPILWPADAKNWLIGKDPDAGKDWGQKEKGTSWQIDGETVETVTDFIFLGSKPTADGDSSHEIERCLLLGRKVMTNLDSLIKSKDITLPTKVHRQNYGFSYSHVLMWELDYKESWPPKNWCFWTVVLEKTQRTEMVWT